MDEAEIARHGFIVAVASLREFVEFIEGRRSMRFAQGIDVAIDRDLNLAVPARGNDRRGRPFLRQCFANISIRIITAIGQQDCGPPALPLPSRGQSPNNPETSACGDLCGYRQSFAVSCGGEF